MVTANSLSEDLNVRMDSLNDSVFEEDKEVVRMAQKAIGDIVARIKPLIHYIGQRLIQKHILVLTKVNDSSCVALDDTGGFGYYNGEEFSPDADSWMGVSFQALLDELKSALKDAEDKRVQHLKAVEVRRKMLEDISKIASGNAVASTQ